ncbi:MAG: hypothetical protein AABX83_03265 [Nanoarchaeota archaeon]
MKTKLSKSQAEQEIKEFFERTKFTSEEVRKKKRLAMKLNIKLGDYKRKFCKSCLSQLKGKTRITKKYKTIECEKCRFNNRFRI